MQFIILIIFAFIIFRLSNRVSVLENKVRDITHTTTDTQKVSAPASTPASVQAAALVVPEVAHAAPQIDTKDVNAKEPSWTDSFVAWAAEDWLLKLGAFIVLLGIGWFVSYAFAQGWIGELGRVTLGVLLGAGLLGFGYHRMHMYVRQGSVFLGLGAMIVLLSVFVAAYGYEIIPARFALILALLTMSYTALASVRFQVKSLAVLSTIIASIAPTTLLIAGHPSNLELFAYLFVVLLGVMWIVAITGWRDLVLVGLTMYAVYAVPRFAFFDSTGESLLLVSYAFALLFFVVNTSAILKAKIEGIRFDMIAAGVNGILLLLAISTYVSPEWRSLSMVGWMLVFLVVAFSVFAATKRREPFFVYTGIAIMMLGAATATELEGAALTIAYIFEAGTIPVVAYLVLRDRAVAASLTALMVIPGILSLGSIAGSWRASVPLDDFFVLFLMGGVLGLLALFFKAIPCLPETPHEEVAPVLSVVGSVYFYVLLWLTLHAKTVIANYDTATMVCLVVYSAIGLLAYAYGKVREHKAVRYYGAGLLAFTVAHLLLIDVWDMALSGRIVTFLLVGALLMGTAFVGRSQKSIQ